MEVKNSAPAHNVPAWLIRFCQWLSTKRGLVWSTLFNIGLSLFTTWLVTANDTDFSKFPVTFFVQHWWITAISFIVLASLTGLAWAIGKLPIVESPAALQRQYLMRRVLQTQDLAIEGIPLLPPRVQLDEIFIPMQLLPHQSDIDQFLTQEQRQLLREGIRSGKVAEEVEPVLIDAERHYERFVRGSQKIEIQDLWQNLSTHMAGRLFRAWSMPIASRWSR